MTGLFKLAILVTFLFSLPAQAVHMDLFNKYECVTIVEYNAEPPVSKQVISEDYLLTKDEWAQLLVTIPGLKLPTLLEWDGAKLMLFEDKPNLVAIILVNKGCWTPAIYVTSVEEFHKLYTAFLEGV